MTTKDWRWVFAIGVALSVACGGSDAGDGPEDEPPCNMLDAAACGERTDCLASDVNVFRLDADGACELVEETSECLERITVTAGCAGFECDSGPGPWVEERADSGTAIARVDQCGQGIAGWSECQETDEGIVPAVCACACGM